MNFTHRFIFTFTLLGFGFLFAQESNSDSLVSNANFSVDSNVTETSADSSVKVLPKEPDPVQVEASEKIAEPKSSEVPVIETLPPKEERVMPTSSGNSFVTMSQLKENARQTSEVKTVEKNNSEKLRFQYGIHLRLGRIVYENSDYDLSGLNWAAGFAFSFPLNENTVFLKVEPVFSVRSLTDVIDSYSSASGYFSRKIFIDEYNVDLPLLITFRIPRSFVQFFAGPQITFNAYEKIKITSEGKTLLEIKDEDSSRNRVEWAIVIGTGIAVSKHMEFDLRLNVGISDVYNDLWINTGSSDNDNWSFSAAGFYMGMSFFL